MTSRLSTPHASAQREAPPSAGPALRCVVAGGSLVGLSAAIALSQLGCTVTVAERSPATAVDGGGGLGVDVDLLRRATGLTEPPVLHGVDRDGTAWHLLHSWLEEHATAIPAVTLLRETDVVTGVRSADAVPGALARYEQVRLRPAIAHVTTSERETAAYLARAANQAAH